MSKVLHCSNCGAPLSRPLDQIDGRLIASPDIRKGEPLTKRGTVYMSMIPLSRRWDGSFDNPVPEAWMRLDDLLDEVGYTTDGRRLIGCCGPDGMQGPN